MSYTVRPISDRAFMTGRHRRSPFRASWGTTEKHLLAEVGKLRGEFLVIEVDVPEAHIRLDGRLRANAVPVTPAVRVCFTARHNDIGDVAYGTDVFSHWRDNVRAVALGLQALRQVDRYGITRDSQQYKGFKAIASGAGSREAAAITLERIAIGDDPEQAAGTVEAIQRRPATAAEVWREARKIAHPDRNGGDRRLWDDVENAARVLGLTGNANRVEVREG